jgi:hypothetical protein
MLMWTMWRFPFWPLGPEAAEGLRGLLVIAGFVFSIVMLVDCLHRPDTKFYRPLTEQGRYDRLIWAGAIVLSLWMYFLGAIVYFFVVKKAEPQEAPKTRAQSKSPRGRARKAQEPTKPSEGDAKE